MLNWILTPIIRNHKKQRGNNIVLQTGTIHDYISHDFFNEIFQNSTFK